MSDLVGNPEDRFSRVEAHMDYVDSNFEIHYLMKNVNDLVWAKTGMAFIFHENNC